MRKFLFMFICCILICVGAYRFCDFKLKDGAKEIKELLYEGVYIFFVPQIVLGETSGKQLAYMEFEKLIFPAFASSRSGGKIPGTGQAGAEENPYTENGQESDTQIGEGNTQQIGDTVTGEETPTETENLNPQTGTAEEGAGEEPENTETIASTPVQDTKKVIINREKLKDFDFLRQNFYQVDNTTTVDSSVLNITKLLEMDVSLSDNTEGPQVLIYHTHSQEGYRDSVEGDEATSVLAVGDYLEKLLTEKGIRVLHHRGEYDVGDRDHAYSNALPSVEKVIADNPSIEVVIDLHRDGVPESLHLVTEIDGRPTAKIMFFNGLSYSTTQGDLSYLANPYIENNLALSFQLQLAAEEYYPGWARKIYLKCYRYNQHICSKCLLVEVGAQNNSLEEAMNAMIPLSDILTKVLKTDKIP